MQKHVVRDYRIILKHLKKLPSHQSSGMVEHVKSQFRCDGANPSDLKLKIENARCYAHMVSSVMELTRLRGLDSGEKLSPREIVKLTASKVGLSVPSFFNEYEANPKGNGKAPPPPAA